LENSSSNWSNSAGARHCVGLAPGASRSFEAVENEVNILVADIRHNRGYPRALTHTGTPMQLTAGSIMLAVFRSDGKRAKNLSVTYGGARRALLKA
jgi:hypothetical protein